MLKIFHVLDKIKPVYDIVEKIMMVICKLLLIADILVTCYIVIGRYISFIDPPVLPNTILRTMLTTPQIKPVTPPRIRLPAAKKPNWKH